MKNNFARQVLILITSIAATMSIFLLISYAGITIGVVKELMIISGKDFYQGETRYRYEDRFIFGILAVIFLVTFYFCNRFFFRSKKDRDYKQHLISPGT